MPDVLNVDHDEAVKVLIYLSNLPGPQYTLKDAGSLFTLHTWGNLHLNATSVINAGLKSESRWFNMVEFVSGCPHFSALIGRQIRGNLRASLAIQSNLGLEMAINYQLSDTDINEFRRIINYGNPDTLRQIS
ncbi:MAG: hypothetical protein F4Z01_02380 [Gammaproteobacteria bacterium]|nr:hypothetical protein [Gammaproteobacteria bacterium]MYF38897.1 hypothetical protein [Gammaproteobacteria bacterium]